MQETSKYLSPNHEDIFFVLENSFQGLESRKLYRFSKPTLCSKKYEEI